MPWTPDNLSVKGALSSFHQAIEAGDTVYDKHCMVYPSTTDTEALTFPGFLPQPREFLDSRQLQGARDFRYNVTNKEYELSLLVTRKNWEDDQTGGVNMRFAESGEVWRTFKDSQLATLLGAGNVSGSNGFDGTTFHATTHTAIGGSGTFVNSITNAVTDESATAGGMLTSEAKTVLNRFRTQFFLFNDDQGRPFNNQAVRTMRVITPAGHEGPFVEAAGANIIVNTTNNFTAGIVQGIDVLPYLTLQTEVYASALGSSRRGFIYQERTALEVIVLADGDQVALNNGVLLLTRQRYVMTYGDPRRNILNILT